MLSQWIEISNAVGLHARPVAMLSAEAHKFHSEIRMRHRDFIADVKSPARLLAMGITAGEIVEVTVEGEDEVAAFAEIMKVLDRINAQ